MSIWRHTIGILALLVFFEKYDVIINLKLKKLEMKGSRQDNLSTTALHEAPFIQSYVVKTINFERCKTKMVKKHF